MMVHRAFIAVGIVLAAIATNVPIAMGQSSIPRLISEKLVKRYLGYLNLSDHQAAEAARLHQNYLEAWSANFDKDIDAFNAKWASTYVDPDTFSGDSMASSFLDACELGDRLKYRLKVSNDGFFDEVQTILSDDQGLRMQRARLAHERFSNARGKSGGLRERHVDLVNILEQMQLNEDDRARVETVLGDFEPVFVELLKTVAEADQRSSVIEFQLLDIDRRFDGQADEASEVEMTHLRQKRGAIGYNAERRLVERIRRGLRQFVEVLSPAAASELQRRYSEEAYEEVYPDPALAVPVYESARGLKGLDENQEAAIDALFEQYLVANQNLSKRMAETYFDLSLGYFKAGPNFVEQTVKPLMAETLRLGIDREKLNLRQPALIRSLLLPEQGAQLPEWKYEKQAPPRRWDPNGPLELPPPRPTTRPTTQPNTQPSAAEGTGP